METRRRMHSQSGAGSREMRPSLKRQQKRHNSFKWDEDDHKLRVLMEWGTVNLLTLASFREDAGPYTAQPEYIKCRRVKQYSASFIPGSTSHLFWASHNNRVIKKGFLTFGNSSVVLWNDFERLKKWKSQLILETVIRLWKICLKLHLFTSLKLRGINSNNMKLKTEWKFI